MNEKLISLLKHAKTCAIQCRELSNDRHKLAITEHVEQLKKAINELESNLASSSSEEHDGRVSDRDELRETLCRLAQSNQDLQMELVRTTGELRSLLLFLSKLDLGVENRINMKISELAGGLNEVKTASLKAFSEIRNRIDAADARIVILEKQLSDADIPAEAETALTELKAISKQLDDIVPDVSELPPTTPPAPV